MNGYKRWLAIAAVPVAAPAIGACKGGQSQSYKDGWNMGVGAGKMSSALATTFCQEAAFPSNTPPDTGGVNLGPIGNLGSGGTTLVPPGDNAQQWVQGCADVLTSGSKEHI
jgi:hypothetical protein